MIISRVYASPLRDFFVEIEKLVGGNADDGGIGVAPRVAEEVGGDQGLLNAV